MVVKQGSWVCSEWCRQSLIKSVVLEDAEHTCTSPLLVRPILLPSYCEEPTAALWYLPHLPPCTLIDLPWSRMILYWLCMMLYWKMLYWNCFIFYPWILNNNNERNWMKLFKYDCVLNFIRFSIESVVGCFHNCQKAWALRSKQLK